MSRSPRKATTFSKGSTLCLWLGALKRLWGKEYGKKEFINPNGGGPEAILHPSDPAQFTHPVLLASEQ